MEILLALLLLAAGLLCFGLFAGSIDFLENI